MESAEQNHDEFYRNKNFMSVKPDLPEQAILAIISWRRAWERVSASPPSLNMGQMPSEIRMWKLAGKLMRIRKIKTKLPS